GPVSERARLKRIVTGEIDMYGNVIARAKAKRKSTGETAGEIIIDLDADPKDELDVSVDLVVTTYECYRAEQKWFKNVFIWRWVILDEGHVVYFHCCTYMISG